jgi:hypothetical protein
LLVVAALGQLLEGGDAFVQLAAQQPEGRVVGRPQAAAVKTRLDQRSKTWPRTSSSGSAAATRARALVPAGPALRNWPIRFTFSTAVMAAW